MIIAITSVYLPNARVFRIFTKKLLNASAVPTLSSNAHHT